MKKVKYILYISLLIFFININLVFAQTDEVAVNEMYKEFFATRRKINSQSGEEYHKDIVKLIDLAIQVIKTSPGSYEACCVIQSFPTSLEILNDLPVIRYKALKSQCYAGLNDPDTDMAEKLFFMRLTRLYVTGFEPGEAHQGEYKKCLDGLKKMKNECKDKNYRALATIALFREKAGEDCRLDFLNKYPEHPAIPDAKLSIASDYYYEKKYQKCIEETNKILEQYKDVQMPEGWNFEVHCYESLAMCYIKLKDIKNAHKFLVLIEEKAPLDPQIEIIKNEIQEIQNSLLNGFQKGYQK
ncbi:MAG: hypothetical protein GYA62_16460 [Bacteroidales bacterium]|nr:hypothetical protein [Bacteroidales bacterium]